MNIPIKTYFHGDYSHKFSCNFNQKLKSYGKKGKPIGFFKNTLYVTVKYMTVLYWNLKTTLKVNLGLTFIFFMSLQQRFNRNGYILGDKGKSRMSIINSGYKCLLFILLLPVHVLHFQGKTEFPGMDNYIHTEDGWQFTELCQFWQLNWPVLLLSITYNYVLISLLAYIHL